MNEKQTTRVCTKCGAEKRSPDAFYKDSRRKDGLTPRCRDCMRAENRIYDATPGAKEKRRQYRKGSGRSHGERTKRRFQKIRKRAKELGVPFDIQRSDMVPPSHCPVLGIQLITDSTESIGSCASVDRIRPHAGYVKGNVKVISMRANRIKNDATPVESAQVALYQARCQEEYIKHLESEIERLKKAQ